MQKIAVTNVNGVLSISENPRIMEDIVFTVKSNGKTVAEFNANKQCCYSPVTNGVFTMPPDMNDRAIFKLRLISQNSKGEREYSEYITIEQEG